MMSLSQSWLIVSRKMYVETLHLLSLVDFFGVVGLCSFLLRDAKLSCNVNTELLKCMLMHCIVVGKELIVRVNCNKRA